MSKVRKLPLILTIPAPGRLYYSGALENTHGEGGWTWEMRRAWIFAELAKIVTLRIEYY